MDFKTAFLSEKTNSGNEIVTMLIGQEDWPFLDTSTDDTMQVTPFFSDRGWRSLRLGKRASPMRASFN